MESSRIAFDLYAVSARLVRLLGSRGAGSLTRQRVSALLILAETGGSSIKDLAEREVVAHSTMSRLVSALNAAGLTSMSKQSAAPGDRRTRAVRLTEKGKRAATRELRRSIALLESRVAKLAERDLAALRHALRVLRDIVSSMSTMTTP